MNFIYSPFAFKSNPLPLLQPLSPAMAEPLNILRSSIHSFLCNYHTFASLSTPLLFPASAATLLSTSLLPSSSSSSSSPSSTLLIAASRRLHSLFDAANLPLSSPLSDILCLKLSQTLLCFLLALPFTLTFLPLSQASIIAAAAELPRRRRAAPPLSSILHLYPPLLLTRLFTTLTILAANVAAFSLFLIAFFFAGELGLASPILPGLAAVAYSTVTANVLVLCNLAAVVSAMESRGGYRAVLKAAVLIRGRAAEALSLSLCSNLAMAAVEALFQARVMRIYNQKRIFFDPPLMAEASTIIYIYSMIRVLEIVVSCGFYRSCRHELLVKCEARFEGVGEFEGEGKRDLKV